MPQKPLFLTGYESFDLSNTHSLSTQDLVKNFIHSFITMTAGESFLKQKTALKNPESE